MAASPRIAVLPACVTSPTRGVRCAARADRDGMCRDQLNRNSAREREELTELRLKARPKTHATTFKPAAEQAAE